MTVFAFDFDGTLTRCDTFLLFALHAVGVRAFIAGVLRSVPPLAGMALHFVPGAVVKERLFSCFFAGMELVECNRRCESFALRYGGSGGRRGLMREAGIRAVRDATRQGEAVIVSASIENWVAPFFRGMTVKVLATQVEVDAAGRLTGLFRGENCKGAEKVRRLLECFPQRNEYRLVAYGDSGGDRELLDEADEAHYRPFRSGEAGAAYGEASRFVMVGGAAVFVQYGCYRILLRAIGGGAGGTVIAYTAGYVISLVVNFVLSTRYTFRVRASGRRLAGFLCAHALNFMFQTGMLHLCIFAGISRTVAPLPVYVVCIPLNFILVRFFLKRGQETAGAA